MNYTPNRFNSSPLSATPASFGIILVCAIAYLTRFQPDSFYLWPLQSNVFTPWQLVTYAFLHGSFNHLFFNMFAVWMFGTPLESTWGTQRFLTYYMSCVVGAGLTQLLVQLVGVAAYPTIGASGGVFGLLLAYGVMWPDNRIFLLFFPVPIKAKWFVLIYGGIELLAGVTGTMRGVAHFAHLGGMILGAVLLYKWGWRPGMTWRR